MTSAARTAAEKSALDRTLGLFLIFCVAIIWVISSFITSKLEKGGEGADNISPFYLTYFATSLFIIYLPLVFFKNALAGNRTSESRQGSPRRSSGPEGSHATLGEGAEQGQAHTPRTPQQQAILAALSSEEAAISAALWSTPLWFTAQWFFNLSLLLTSITSNTIISSTSSLFTFGFSVALLGERFTWRKFACVLACIGGTALVTLADKKESGGAKSALGDMMTVAAAGLYGAYTVVMRLRMPEDDEASVALFFGYVGLFATLALAPVVVVLSLTGIAPFPHPPPETVAFIVISGLLNYVLSDYLWARAVLLVGPTVATLGLSIQIPIATTAEILLKHPAWVHHTPAVLLTLAGTGLILAGFFGINRTGAEAEQESAGGALDWWEREKGRVLQLLGMQQRYERMSDAGEATAGRA